MISAINFVLIKGLFLVENTDVSDKKISLENCKISWAIDLVVFAKIGERDGRFRDKFSPSNFTGC
ncbi:hypothetical protein T01_7592 [Trichinella spiralis]|uniref:Uncharacterized protein n=1 Tax=Trichinella spiralis TaxID=6334 RepID=A0A0V1B5M8_TRISP|nr:hypothetical protein T01_7592 [Trichinella spiralis]